jgi:hypothetical protein
MSLALLTGCAERPLVAQKPITYQEKADSLRDWELVASKIAADMMAVGLLHDPAHPLAPGTPTELPPYYVNVRDAHRPSPFLQEVGKSLQVEILRHGGAVANAPGAGTAIDLDVTIVGWPPRPRPPIDTAPNTEIAWEASITQGSRVIFAQRYPMYVNDVDATLYAGLIPPIGPPPVQLRYAR